MPCRAHTQLCCLLRPRQALEGWWPGLEALFDVGPGLASGLAISDSDLRSLVVYILPLERLF